MTPRQGPERRRSLFALLVAALTLSWAGDADAFKVHREAHPAAEACDYIAAGDQEKALTCYTQVKAEPTLADRLVRWHRFQQHLRAHGPGCRIIQEEVHCWDGRKSLSPDGLQDILQDAWR